MCGGGTTSPAFLQLVGSHGESEKVAVGNSEEEGLARGSRVRVRINGMDLLTLDLHATLAARLDEPAASAPPMADEAGEEDEIEPAGALQLAFEVDDPAAVVNPPQADEAG